MRSLSPRPSDAAFLSVGITVTALAVSCAQASSDFTGAGGSGGFASGPSTTSAQKGTSSTSGPTSSPSTSGVANGPTSSVTGGSTASSTSAVTSVASSSTGGGACHDPCTVGTPLTALCFIAAPQVFICSNDVCGNTGLDYCCTSNWDAACVAGAAASTACFIAGFICP